MKSPGVTAIQYAGLPLQERDGETCVLLVTSRETHRWVLPKGWGEKGLTGAQVAAKEAFEEAGIQGSASDTPVGRYRYTKRLRKGQSVDCEVEVYPLMVDALLPDWPERTQRCREWFTLAQAALVIDDGELVPLLLRLAAPE
ncbi:MAG: NUDIX hydrolase [Alphaproteobacteria bacterium]|nr:MAG: NUDIX hydrolase [Alphaproteobacteria bacterium]